MANGTAQAGTAKKRKKKAKKATNGDHQVDMAGFGMAGGIDLIVPDMTRNRPIRIKQEAGYKLFSPFFVPTLDAYDTYACHVGLGYQRIVSEFHGIRTDVTIFVPNGENVVLRDIKVTNLRDEPLDLDVIPVSVREFEPVLASVVLDLQPTERERVLAANRHGPYLPPRPTRTRPSSQARASSSKPCSGSSRRTFSSTG